MTTDTTFLKDSESLGWFLVDEQLSGTHFLLLPGDADHPLESPVSSRTFSQWSCELVYLCCPHTISGEGQGSIVP